MWIRLWLQLRPGSQWESLLTSVFLSTLDIYSVHMMLFILSHSSGVSVSPLRAAAAAAAASTLEASGNGMAAGFMVITVWELNLSQWISWLTAERKTLLKLFWNPEEPLEMWSPHLGRTDRSLNMETTKISVSKRPDYTLRFSSSSSLFTRSLSKLQLITLTFFLQ